MKILHIVPGLDDPTNGIAVAAKWIVESQRKSGHEVDLVDTKEFVASSLFPHPSSLITSCSEVWVHSMWLPMTLRACWKVLRSHAATGVPRLVRMPHGCLDPVKIRYHYWKKLMVMPFEKFFMRRAARIVATEEAEVQWIRKFIPSAVHLHLQPLPRPIVQMLDLGSTVGYAPRPGLGNRKFLFVGRLHPLKGLDALIAAIRAMGDEGKLPLDFVLTVIGKDEKGLCAEYERLAAGLPIRFLGEVTAEVKEKEMASADCLVLPTLSENFALVVKESLVHGVPVITTDGAKIWKGHKGVTYIDHFVESSQSVREALLRAALTNQTHP